MLGNFHGTSATSVPGGEPCSSRCDRRSGIESSSMIGSKLQPTRHIEGIVAFFLGRTCGKPFSFIYIRTSRTHDIRQILAHSEQWEEACIRLQPYELEYLCDIKGRPPLLEELDIDMIRRGQDHWRMEAANIFEDAPLLTHVVLWDAPGPFKFNWSSLTVVSF